jgi:hypothetical protein
MPLCERERVGFDSHQTAFLKNMNIPALIATTIGRNKKGSPIGPPTWCFWLFMIILLIAVYIAGTVPFGRW